MKHCKNLILLGVYFIQKNATIFNCKMGLISFSICYSSGEVQHGPGQSSSLPRARHRQYHQVKHPSGQRHRPPHRQALDRSRISALEVSGRRGLALKLCLPLRFWGLLSASFTLSLFRRFLELFKPF